MSDADITVNKFCSVEQIISGNRCVLNIICYTKYYRVKIVILNTKTNKVVFILLFILVFCFFVFLFFFLSFFLSFFFFSFFLSFLFFFFFTVIVTSPCGLEFTSQYELIVFREYRDLDTHYSVQNVSVSCDVRAFPYKGLLVGLLIIININFPYAVNHENGSR